MPISVIHDRLATSAMLFSAICVVWGLFNYIRKQPVTSGYWGGLVILNSDGSPGWLRHCFRALGRGTAASTDRAYPLRRYDGDFTSRSLYLYQRQRYPQRNLIYALVSLWLVFIVSAASPPVEKGWRCCFPNCLFNEGPSPSLDFTVAYKERSSLRDWTFLYMYSSDKLIYVPGGTLVASGAGASGGTQVA